MKTFMQKLFCIVLELIIKFTINHHYFHCLKVALHLLYLLNTVYEKVHNKLICTEWILNVLPLTIK